MKNILALTFAFIFAFAPIQESKAVDVISTTVVGAAVSVYAGGLAGVGASSILFGTALSSALGKEAALNAAANDIQAYFATGEISLNLENTIMSIQSLDESISEEEAMDLILEAANA